MSHAVGGGLAFLLNGSTAFQEAPPLGTAAVANLFVQRSGRLGVCGGFFPLKLLLEQILNVSTNTLQ